jgi:transcriptional regulator with XRE-family HTH domain
LSQGELARQLGISSSFLSRLESGDKKLPRELASDLANTLGLETNLVALRAGHLPEAIAQWVAAHPEILLAAMHSSPSGEVQLDESGN